MRASRGMGDINPQKIPGKQRKFAKGGPVAVGLDKLAKATRSAKRLGK